MRSGIDRVGEGQALGVRGQVKGDVPANFAAHDDRAKAELGASHRDGVAVEDARLAVLDLKTMTERLIAAETRWIDDQVEWLDSGHVLYAVPGRTKSISDVWVAPIDGSAPAMDAPVSANTRVVYLNFTGVTTLAKGPSDAHTNRWLSLRMVQV